MRVRHNVTGQTGTITASEPEYHMGAAWWPIEWDEESDTFYIDDDDLTVL